MKKLGIFLVVLALLICIPISLIFYLTSGLNDTAMAFFGEISTRNYNKSYSYLSEAFKKNTTKDEFIKFIEESGLEGFKEVSWSSRSISGKNQGNFDGSVITNTGENIPIKMSFVKENSDWKIFSLFISQAGASYKNSNNSLPPIDQLMKLTDESMLKFANSVNAKDFKEFHSHVSNLWQKQYTIIKFNETFKSFIDAEIDLLPALKVTNPIFDVEPIINSDNILILKGHYPTNPSQIHFELKYIQEGIKWKLIGTSIYLKE